MFFTSKFQFGCTQLAKLDNLTSLNLSQNERITNRGAAALASLSNLRALNLSNTKVTAAALQFLGALSKLQSLALYGCQGVDENTSISLLHNELPSLKCLRLNGNKNNDIVSSEEEEDSDEEETIVDQSIASLNSATPLVHPDTARLWEDLGDSDSEVDSEVDSNVSSSNEYTEMVGAIEVNDGIESDEEFLDTDDVDNESNEVGNEHQDDVE